MAARSGESGALYAWLLASVYYFYQYVLRSSPSVMMPLLSDAFGLSALGAATFASLFYYSYAITSLAAGPALDGLGARATMPIAAIITGAGALLVGLGNLPIAYSGRLLQGVGGAFSFVGAVYIASRNFAPARAATLTGAAQMFGMAGGSAGQFVVGPMIAGGLPWRHFWIAMGVAGFLIGAALLAFLKKEEPRSQRETGITKYLRPLGIVFRNPQSILCGVIAGLLFIPTTIFDMTWGVRYLQEARQFDYGDAVIRSAMVPLGWIIGAPLLGLISDRLGRRKPVIAGGGFVMLVCIALVLYGPANALPPYALGLILGIASGAAMLPYTVIKEVNPPEFSGTAIGVINFLNLAFTAVLGPIFGWILQRESAGGPPGLEHYQPTFKPLLFGIALALALTVALKETGRAAVQNPLQTREAA